jgi:hypothetical protein
VSKILAGTMPEDVIDRKQTVQVGRGSATSSPNSALWASKSADSMLISMSGLVMLEFLPSVPLASSNLYRPRRSRSAGRASP